MNDVARTAQTVCPSPPRGCFCGDAGEDVIKKDMPTKIAPRCEWSCSSLAFREFNSTADGYATKRSPSPKPSAHLRDNVLVGRSSTVLGTNVHFNDLKMGWSAPAGPTVWQLTYTVPEPQYC